MKGHSKKVAVHKLGREASLETESIGALTVDLLPLEL